MQLIDSHCHLNFPQFDPDRAAVLARAGEAGVVAILNPAIDLDSTRQAIELASLHPEVFAAAGIHPCHSDSVSGDWIAELRELASAGKVVAIGECGLDFVKGSNFSLQEKVFRAQVQLARELDLPLIIHSRGAEKECAAILAEYPGVRGVAHSFTGSVEVARDFLAIDFYIGLTGIVTFKNAPEIHELAQLVPLRKLLIETDAPYLSPEPHRGQRAEPGFVRFVAGKIAELKNLPLEEIAAATTRNACELFRMKMS